MSGLLPPGEADDRTATRINGAGNAPNCLKAWAGQKHLTKCGVYADDYAGDEASAPADAEECGDNPIGGSYACGGNCIGIGRQRTDD